MSRSKVLLRNIQAGDLFTFKFGGKRYRVLQKFHDRIMIELADDGIKYKRGKRFMVKPDSRVAEWW